VAVFGNLGKGIAVLLLIVQVTGCGGSYPLPILPDFVQAVSPWLPATHVVDAMRAAMFGVYQNDFWISMGKLALYILPFLFIGLVLRKPLGHLMRNYLKKVDKCGLME
jgi:putative membrane protein